jgi:hypothetical protein
VTTDHLQFWDEVLLKSTNVKFDYDNTTSKPLPAFNFGGALLSICFFGLVRMLYCAGEVKTPTVDAKPPATELKSSLEAALASSATSTKQQAQSPPGNKHCMSCGMKRGALADGVHVLHRQHLQSLHYFLRFVPRNLLLSVGAAATVSRIRGA